MARITTPKPHLTLVTTGSHILWFSYEALVAFVTTATGLVVLQGKEIPKADAGIATFTHLNYIDGGQPDHRKPKQEFDNLAQRYGI